MRRFVPIGILCAFLGYLAGSATSQQATLAAQAGGTDGVKRTGLAPGPPASRLQDGKAFVISGDDVRQKFPPADKTGKVAPTNLSTNLGWDPVFSLVVMRRPYMDPPVKSNNSGNMVRWSDAEMHEQKAQLYFIMGGTGNVALGGKPGKTRTEINNGQWGGEPLGAAQGATLQRVKAGDIVVIPTYAWHQAQADAGQTLTYMKVDIQTPRLMP